MFEFKIYDIHVKQKFDDLGELYTHPQDGINWLTFDFAVDLNQIKIDCFRAFVLFDDEDTPINCTKVHLGDGSFVYAKVNYETFKKNYYGYLLEVRAALDKAESN
jgi:hypothetical protein